MEKSDLPCRTCPKSAVLAWERFDVDFVVVVELGLADGMGLDDSLRAVVVAVEGGRRNRLSPSCHLDADHSARHSARTSRSPLSSHRVSSGSIRATIFRS